MTAHAVTLVDPDGLGQRTSRGNAGGIVHVDILPLASPKVWREIPRWLVDPLGPFSIRPSYVLSILPWLIGFVRASTPAQVERSTLALIGLNGVVARGLGAALEKARSRTDASAPARLRLRLLFEAAVRRCAADAAATGGARLPARAADRPCCREASSSPRSARPRSQASTIPPASTSTTPRALRLRSESGARPRRDAGAGSSHSRDADRGRCRDATEFGTNDRVRHGRDRRRRVVPTALRAAW